MDEENEDLIDDQVIVEEPVAEEQPETQEQEEEVSITLGDEPAEEEKEPAPTWVKDLRRQHRELARENKELKAKLVPQAQVIDIGKKPQINDDDIAYDADKFEAKLLEWNEKKRKVEDQKKEAENRQKKLDEEWQSTLENYATAKKSVKVSDFDDAEFLVHETLSVEQQGILLHGAQMPAELVYALGKNPKEAKSLAEIKDPVKFAFAVARLEATKLKVTKKEPTPGPERRVTGSAPVSGANDSTLDRLRREAEKTGDFSKVVAYKKSRQK